MTIEEFESHYRNAMSDTLNQLQMLSLLTAQVESSLISLNSSNRYAQSLSQMTDSIRTRIFEIGNSVKRLSLQVEEFIDDHKA